MTFKQFIALMGVATGIIWVAFFWTIFSIDPFQTNGLGFFFFYTALFIALTGSLTLFGVWYRKREHPEGQLYPLVFLSVRQAILLATFCCTLLFMQSQRFVRIWNVILLFLLIVTIELVLLRKDQRWQQSAQNEKDEDYTPQPFFEKKSIE